MTKNLLSEQSVLEASKRGATVLHYEKGTIITTAAQDRARQLGIKLLEQPKDVQQPPSPAKVQPSTPEVIALGSDHGGFATKEQLKSFIEGLGHKVVDVGTSSEEACDYPQFAYAVAKMVSIGEATKGIMVDAVGVASAMVANKVPGIRAACCHNEFSARSSREHNDANVLTLGGRVLGIELSKAIVKAWLETPFAAGRHVKRVEMIKDIEKKWGK
ncbi:MAG: ribose 5-phosphate isomerase B [Bacteroidetes bacterium]|nr:MAG: ribose 5-phosphate isomerase B [Bacteroidota bacterium]